VRSLEEACIPAGCLDDFDHRHAVFQNLGPSAVCSGMRLWSLGSLDGLDILCEGGERSRACRVPGHSLLFSGTRDSSLGILIKRGKNQLFLLFHDMIESFHDVFLPSVCVSPFRTRGSRLQITICFTIRLRISPDLDGYQGPGFGRVQAK
jgi:hypothetical protein